MVDYSALDDFELLQFLKKDDEHAYTEIYNRYWKLLFYTAYNVIQTKTEVQDAIQEVFIALWQRRKEAVIQNLKPYLLQATRFQVLKAIRVQKTDELFYSRLAAVTADIVYENPMLFNFPVSTMQQMAIKD